MNATQPRQPEGIPTGGQYAATPRDESTAVLTSIPEPLKLTPGALEFIGGMEHAAQLAERGYASPRVLTAMRDPRERYSAQEAKAWWTQALMVSAEHPLAPEDWGNDGRTGRAASGMRRARRMRLKAEDIDMKIMSVRGIKSWAAEAGPTVSIPYSAVNAAGQKIEGTVAVTDLGDGTWAVNGEGMGGRSNARISELVCASLEGRRVEAGDPKSTGALLDAYKAMYTSRGSSTLLDQHRLRVAQQGVEVSPVKSTWQKAAGYSAAARMQVTVTANGNAYGHEVDQATYDQYRKSPSPGAYFNQVMKKSGRPVAVDRCSKCSRYYAKDKGHRCPAPVEKMRATSSRGKAAVAEQRQRAQAVAQQLVKRRDPSA